MLKSINNQIMTLFMDIHCIRKFVIVGDGVNSDPNRPMQCLGDVNVSGLEGGESESGDPDLGYLLKTFSLPYFVVAFIG